MSRPGFYFCFCPDSNLLKMQIERLLNLSGQKDWQIKVFWLDEQDQEDSLWKALNLPGMTGLPRAVILRKCDALPSSFWKDISRTINGFKPSILPFFCFEAQWDKGKPKIPPHLLKKKYYIFAREKGWIWEFPGLTRGNIARYIIQRCEKLGIKRAPGVLDRLRDLLPLDSSAVDLEMDKLKLLIYPDNIIGPEHLEAIACEMEMDIFSFLGKVQQGTDIPAAWSKIFREQLKGQEMLFPFLGLLLREARLLWHLASGQEHLVRLHPRVKKQKLDLARNMGQTRIAQLWEMVLEADSGVKSGLVSSGQAMDTLTAGLFRLFSRQAE